MDIDRESNHEFGAIHLPPPRYSETTRQSLYLRMRDGVRLALDLRLPAPLPAGEKLPALLSQSRYWRGLELRAPFKWLFRPEDINPYHRDYYRMMTGQGYALVSVDVRGTGASFGCWEYPWHDDTVEDSFEIVEWIVSQPWSNGRVGGMGISYLGTTAELLAACRHPAVKATAALFNHPDAFTDIAFPGGIFNERFMRAWGEMDEVLDRNQIPDDESWLARHIARGVQPVDGQEHLLEQAVQDHCNNGSIYLLARKLTFRDEYVPEMEGGMGRLLVERHLDAIRLSGAAICGFGSWMDAGTADAVIRRFLTLDNACLGVIGAWDHGGQRNASPYRRPIRPGNPPLGGQWKELIRFFEPYLKPGQDPAQSTGEKTLHYYTMGEEKWKSTSVWPPKEMARQRWYLAGEHSLSWEMLGEGRTGSSSDKDEFVVDFEASTGRYNRWWELGPAHNRGVAYRRRKRADRHMLAYLTPPLERDLEISGYPIIRLFVISTETDGAFFVYLEEMDEQGEVHYITEGELRAIHRKVSTEPAPYVLQVPYHTYRDADAMPLVPGEPAELHFGLLPTSVLIRRGHRLRLGIAGHDEGTFTRLPPQGQPRLTVLRSLAYPSYIEFPAAWRGL